MIFKNEEIPNEIKEKSGKKKKKYYKEYQKDYRRKHQKEMEAYQKDYRLEHEKEIMEKHKDYRWWRKRISILKFFEEGKSITLNELLEKSGVIEENDIRRNIMKIGKIRDIINESKEKGLVIEVQKDMFQINPKSESLEMFKKILKKEKNKKDKYGVSSENKN